MATGYLMLISIAFTEITRQLSFMPCKVRIGVREK